jgi:hypothetical protein
MENSTPTKTSSTNTVYTNGVAKRWEMWLAVVTLFLTIVGHFFYIGNALGKLEQKVDDGEKDRAAMMDTLNRIESYLMEHSK